MIGLVSVWPEMDRKTIHHHRHAERLTDVRLMSQSQQLLGMTAASSSSILQSGPLRQERRMAAGFVDS